MDDATPKNGARCSRRSFLAGTTGGLAVAALLPGCAPTPAPRGEFLPAEALSWWREGRYFVHETVDSRQRQQGLIRARVDGKWQDFRTVTLPARFREWSFAERRAKLHKLAAGGFDTRDLAGPHNGWVATYGGHPQLGRVSLNTAYKGMGWLPRPDRLREMLAALQGAARQPEPQSKEEFLEQMRWKASYLDSLYAQPDLFDPAVQSSLELFTTPRYFTHTFLNMMENPIASASFLAYPTFELRAIPELLHPDDPNLREDQRLAIHFINEIHNFVHGGGKLEIACLYHIIEVYDDTPTRGAAGKKLA